jgi:hypothetical protein
MNGRAWEIHEIDKLTTFHSMGLSIQEQADRLGRPHGSVCTKRQELGLSYRDETFLEEWAKEIEASSVPESFRDSSADKLQSTIILAVAAVSALILFGMALL